MLVRISVPVRLRQFDTRWEYSVQNTANQTQTLIKFWKQFLCAISVRNFCARPHDVKFRSRDKSIENKIRIKKISLEIRVEKKIYDFRYEFRSCVSFQRFLDDCSTLLPWTVCPRSGSLLRTQLDVCIQGKNYVSWRLYLKPRPHWLCSLHSSCLIPRAWTPTPTTNSLVFVDFEETQIAIQRLQ